MRKVAEKYRRQQESWYTMPREVVAWLQALGKFRQSGLLITLSISESSRRKDKLFCFFYNELFLPKAKSKHEHLKHIFGMSALDQVELQRQQLEENVAKLRKTLQHWRTWDAEYEGLKEEIETSDFAQTEEGCVSRSSSHQKRRALLIFNRPESVKNSRAN